MIRFLQQDNKLVKGVFVVFIAAAVGAMVITLVPGIFDNVGATGDANTFGTVKEPGFFGRIFGESLPITQQEIGRAVQQQAQGRQVPAYIMPYLESRAGQQLVQQKILKIEADRRGLQVSNADLRSLMHEGELGTTFFPGGKYIGDDAYMNLIQTNLNMTIPQFEDDLKERLAIQRLEQMITGGVTVPDNEVRNSFRVSGTKVKFDYAVVSATDLAKTVNPTDSDLQAFFTKNAPRYAQAVGETRKIQYVSFGVDQLPGGRPQVTDADIQAYYTAHRDAYKVSEQVKARHILIAVPQGSDAARDAAAKTKAQGILQELRNGGDFAALAKANSDDPGSKDSGGDLGFFGRKRMVPPFEKAAFALQAGQTSDLVKTDFGYHIIQVLQHDTEHIKPVSEVKAEIVPVLEQQKLGAAEQNFALALVAQAKKDGLDKAAAGNKLNPVTTDYVARDGTVAGVADSAQMLQVAFQTTRNGVPQSVSTGDGMAVFQVVDIKAPHAPDFASYKANVLTDYRNEQVPNMLKAQLDKLDKRAKELNDLHKAAAEMNVAVKSSDLVGKDGQVPDVGSMAGPGAAAFDLAKGGISGPLDLGQTGVVLQVTDKQEPNTDEIAKNFNTTRNTLLNTKREEVFDVYLGTLQEKYQKAGAIRLRAKPTTPGLPLGS